METKNRNHYLSLEKIFRILWYAVAFGITLYLGWEMWETGKQPFTAVCIFVLTVFLGYMCVSVLVGRSPIWSNVLGMSANVGEIYTQYLFGNLGLAASSFYYFITHILGLSLWTQKKNQDRQGKVKISKINYTSLVLTILFCVLGVLIMYFYGETIIGKETSFWLFILNCIAFVIGVSAQFTMIMRQPFSWILWSVSNLIWFTVNLLSHNYIFAVQSVLYEINALIGVYKWYKESGK